MCILVVDDDAATLRFIRYALEQDGFSTIGAADSQTALVEFQKGIPELVILDVSLPSNDGFELCRQIRRNSQVPIIFVSSRTQTRDRVLGLQIGGDDYLAKPFDPEELVARVHAVLRRAQRTTKQEKQLSCGGITLNPVERVVTLPDNHKSDLTPIEFRLLHYLMQHAGRVVPTEQLLSNVWGYDDDSARNLVAVYIRRLRTKIDQNHQRQFITTIANLGYRFEM